MNAILQDNFLMTEQAFERMLYSLHTMLPLMGKDLRQEEKLYTPVRFMDEDLNPVPYDEITEGSTAIVELRGGMVTYASWFWQSAVETVAVLDKLNNDNRISSIVLDVDGWGGAASAIPHFIEFAKRKRKPIAASINNAYSLHYWMVCAVADEGMVFCNNDITAGVGSVGATTSFMTVKKYFEKMGVGIYHVYPKESKDKNKISRLIDDNPKEAVKLLEKELSPLAIKFQEAIRQARPNIKEGKGQLTGDTFRASEALKHGMIDGVHSLAEILTIIEINK